MKKVVVTGGSGRVGGYILRHMASTYRLVNADLVGSRQDVPFVQTDVMDLQSVRRSLTGADAVIHLAGIDFDWDEAPEKVMQVNTMGTWHVLQAAAELDIRKVVLCSSISICGLQELRADWPPAFLPIDESHENRPVFPYGVSKQIVEVMGQSFARRGGMEVICIRPLAVVMPETFTEFLEFVDTPGRKWLSYYVTAQDLARAFEAAVEAEGLGFASFYIGADDSTRPEPTLDWLRDMLGALPRLANPRLYRTNPRASVFGNARAKALLGWVPTSDFQELRARHGDETA